MPFLREVTVGMRLIVAGVMLISLGACGDSVSVDTGERRRSADDPARFWRRAQRQLR